MSRLYSPMLSEYKGCCPSWAPLHRPVTNTDRSIFIPPTVIQVHRAFAFVEARYANAPRVRMRLLEAMQLLMHGIPPEDIPFLMRKKSMFSRLVDAARMLRSTRRLGAAWREFRFDPHIRVNAVPAALGLNRQFCNGF